MSFLVALSHVLSHQIQSRMIRSHHVPSSHVIISSRCNCQLIELAGTAKLVLSCVVLSCYDTSYSVRVLSFLVLSCLVKSRPVASHHVKSGLIPAFAAITHSLEWVGTANKLVLSHFVPSRPIQSCPVWSSRAK
ncbi:MAG: hypothetical protein KIT59_01020 [Nitrosomonas sp.]|nr:hypothetical protein [Nitrosomonas sp.]